MIEDVIKERNTCRVCLKKDLEPIISEEQARKEKPDYFLVLPWYFIDEFKVREKEFLNNGGKFIVTRPSFKIIEKD